MSFEELENEKEATVEKTDDCSDTSIPSEPTQEPAPETENAKSE
jgi:hypothetical protein